MEIRDERKAGEEMPMRFSVEINCRCGHVASWKVNAKDGVIYLVDAIELSAKGFKCRPTMDYTTMIICKCGNEIELM